MENWKCIDGPKSDKFRMGEKYLLGYECSNCGRPVLALPSAESERYYASITNYHFCPYCGVEIRYEKIERPLPKSYHDVNYIYPEDRRFFDIKKEWYWSKTIPQEFIEEKLKEGYSKEKIVSLYMDKLGKMTIEELGLPTSRNESIGLAN